MKNLRLVVGVIVILALVCSPVIAISKSDLISQYQTGQLPRPTTPAPTPTQKWSWSTPSPWKMTPTPLPTPISVYQKWSSSYTWPSVVPLPVIMPALPTLPPTPVPPVISPNSSVVYISDLNVLDEYVQLTNRGTDPVAMTGWTIANNRGSSFYFLQWTNPDGSKYDYELGGHSTVTISTGREGTPTQTHLYWPEKMWNDTGDTAYLTDKNGNLVSTLTR